jgi:hypothetical protein
VLVGFGGLALVHDEAWHVYLSIAVSGLGVGPVLNGYAQPFHRKRRTKPDRVATGVSAVMRTIGGSFGT